MNESESEKNETHDLRTQLKLLEDFSKRGFWLLLDAIYQQSESTAHVQCIVCDFAGHQGDFEVLVDKCVFGGGELKRYKCPMCDCIFGPLKYLNLEQEFVNLDYQLLYSRYSESNSTENEISAFYALNPEKQANALYLDWGAGGGWSECVNTLREEGFDVWGYEPSIEVSSGHIVKSTDEISAKFDGIFSNNVIEHFRKPVEQFRYFHQILRDNGKMVHQSPCYEYKYTYTRFHTLFLLGRSPEILAERTGFKATCVSKTPDTTCWLYEKL